MIGNLLGQAGFHYTVLLVLCDRLEAALSEANTTRTRLLSSLLYEALHGPTPTTVELEAAS